MNNLIYLLRKPVLLFLFLTSSYLGVSQHLNKSFSEFVTNQNRSVPNTGMLSENRIKGSAYLNKEFISGEIITKDSIRYQDVPLRYNIYNDDIEFEVKENNYLAISNPESIKEIHIGNRTFIYDVKTTKKGEKSGYYELLHAGNTKLLACYHIVFKEAQTSNGITKAAPPRFVRDSNTFHLKIGDEAPKQIARKKDLQSIFSKDSKEVLSFVKQEKINVRREAQLIKLVEFLNQMN